MKCFWMALSDVQNDCLNVWSHKHDDVHVQWRIQDLTLGGGVDFVNGGGGGANH